MNTKNQTRYRSLNKIAADPRVIEIWDEGEDGIWIALADGYICADTETHCVHEWNCRDLIASFQSVEKEWRKGKLRWEL